jgi:hypothetical protein
LSPLFEGLQSDKHRNLKTLEELVLISTDFIYDVNSKKPTSSSVTNSSGNSQEDLNRSASPSLPSVPRRSSFEDYHEVRSFNINHYFFHERN